MCIPQDCDDRSKEAKRNIPFGWGRFFFLIHSLSTLIPQRPAPRGRFPFLLFLRHHRTRQLHHKIVIKRTREFRDSFNRLIVEGFHKLMRPPPSRLKSREKPAETHWAASEKKAALRASTVTCAFTTVLSIFQAMRLMPERDNNNANERHREISE